MQDWSASELRAVQSRNKRRVWAVEITLKETIFRAAQTIRNVTDAEGREWIGYGDLGEVNGVGTSSGRRPREVTIALHGIAPGQSLYQRIKDAGAVGAATNVFMMWVDADERVIVNPKPFFNGVIARNPSIQLGDTDRVSLLVVAGANRANRLASPWDRTPVSHRSFVGQNDPIYDRVTSQTQTSRPL